MARFPPPAPPPHRRRRRPYEVSGDRGPVTSQVEPHSPGLCAAAVVSRTQAFDRVPARGRGRGRQRLNHLRGVHCLCPPRWTLFLTGLPTLSSCPHAPASVRLSLCPPLTPTPQFQLPQQGAAGGGCTLHRTRRVVWPRYGDPLSSTIITLLCASSVHRMWLKHTPTRTHAHARPLTAMPRT